MGVVKFDVTSVDGRSVIVTGGNSGIGWHAAHALATAGARVTIACRDVRKGKAAAETMGADVAVAELDLASMQSIRDFADTWDGPLHLLINNAGVMAPPRFSTTKDGFELQFGTNHLGHFVLTGLLLPALLAEPPARVVTVASLAHHGGTAAVLAGNIDRVNYDGRQGYQNSKLANLLFATELQRRADEHGASLISTAAHPGLAYTGLFRDKQGVGARPLVGAAITAGARVVCQSAKAGAGPTLYAATTATPGSYSGPQHFRESRGGVGPAKRSRTAQDPQLARDLWRVSEELTGLHYSW